MWKVMIVDDEEDVCKLIATMLSLYDYQVVAETNSGKVMDRLRAEEFDVVIIDLFMPVLDGLDLLYQIKQLFEDLPVIIITGFGSIEAAVESMQAGAADFVTKPLEAAVLDIRIKKAIEHAQMKHLANRDGLTALHNYRSFQIRLEQEVERANRYHRPLSLIMLDIDDFKIYNDTYGHPQGDIILAQVARILQQLSRASDIVARYGGEEFALILPETDKQNAAILGNRLREAIEQHKFPGEERLPSNAVTVSVGIASHTLAETKEALIVAADAVLYQAKREGRNRVRVMT